MKLTLREKTIKMFIKRGQLDMDRVNVWMDEHYEMAEKLFNSPARIYDFIMAQ